MMRALAFALLAGVAAPLAAQPPQLADPTSFASAADIQAAVAKARTAIPAGQAQFNVPLLRGGSYSATIEYRRAPTPASVHLTVAETILVVAGHGTFVLGGTLAGAKPNGSNISGTGIDGGVSRSIGPGDMLLVPAGTPHLFAKIDGELAAVTMKLPVTPAP